MILNLGIVPPGTTLYIPFHTFDSNDPSASVTLTGLATTDIEIYKDGSITQRASDSGYALLDTDGIDFDGITGIHGLSINLADNTTAGFYASGSQYWVVISSVTVDAATINFVLATFRIGYPQAFLNTTIATLSSQTSFTLTAGPAEDDALNGCMVLIHDVASAVQLGTAVVQDYTGSTKTVTLTAGVTFTAAATDNISIFPPVNAQYGGAVAYSTNRGLAGLALPNAAADAAGGLIISDAGGLDADAQLVTKINDILTDTGTTLQGELDGIQADTEDIQTRLPAALVSGRIDASVGAMANNVITAAAINADAITDAKVASDVTIASVTGAVGSVTGNVGGNVAGSVGSVTAGVTLANDAITSAKFDESTAYPLTAAEKAIIAKLSGLVMVSGTIGSTGNSTTALHLDGLTYGDDEINNCLIVILDVSTGEYHARWVEDWADTGDLATVATLPFTPENAVDTYWLLPVRQDVTGGSGLDAAGVRAAIGMSSANLDTQLADIEGKVDDVEGELAKVPKSDSNVTWNATAAAQIQSEANDALVANHLDHLLAATYDPASKPGAADALLNELVEDDGGVSRYTANALEQAPSGTGASAEAIADEVETRTIAGVTTVGTVNALADNSVTAAALAADAVTEIQSGLATATELAKVPKSDSNVTWNATAAAQIQSEANDALVAYDPPTRAELTSDVNSVLTILGTPAGASLAADLAAIFATVDTEVAAIKAKTDNLPADPADASDVAAAIAALNDLSAADVNAEVVDALAVDTYAEPTGVPAATITLATKIGWLFMALRNGITITSTKKTFLDDGGAAEWEKDLSDDGTTYTESEGNTP